MPEAQESDHHPDVHLRGSAAAAALLSETFYSAGAVGGAPPLTLPVASRKDVDFLVQEIKENLKLGHSLKSRSSALSHRASHRASPYPRVPNPSRQCDSSDPISGLKKWNHRRRYPSTCMNTGGGITGSGNPSKKASMAKKDSDDPFEMLQELISDGSLIKEAVRRLQMGFSPKFSTNRDFYDSDEDCRTPPASAYPDLCCEVAGI